MRVIKLSPDDTDMKTREKVDWFFLTHLHERRPEGQFFFPKGRIAEDGIQPGEWLIFTYLGSIVYIARSASNRLESKGNNAHLFPFYFCIDTNSIRQAKGSLSALEDILRRKEILDCNLVKSQGWPIVDEAGTSRDIINDILTRFAVKY